MFFVQNYVEIKSLSDLWKAAHGFHVGSREDGPALQETCTKLCSLVRSDAIETSQRLSLRTSSTLAAGAARILMQDLDHLLEDAQEVIREMRWRRKRYTILTDRFGDTSSVTSSLPRPSPETLCNSQILNKKGSLRIASQDYCFGPFNDESGGDDDDSDDEPAPKRVRLGL